jgi:putative tryptophan/tyrosine transport system substrate-binding protein
MNRRDLLTLIGGVAVWPVATRAQQEGMMPVVGFLNPNSPDATPASTMAFLEGLKEGGYVEGRNVAIEYRWAEGHNDRLPALAADLVRRQVKMIVAGGDPAALAAKAATTTIPIVFQLGADPVKAGLVARLNRPGGNITGVTNISTTLAAKRLELLHQLAPDAATIAILVDPTGPASDTQRSDLQEAASALGLQLLVLNAGNDQEIDAAFAIVVQQRVGALLLTDTTFFNARREQLIALSRFNAVPTMYTFREFAVAGGLISYASHIADAWRRAGNYVARILNGERPGDLPIQQPTKFELVINLKTAKTLGLTIPESFLLRADEVIE